MITVVQGDIFAAGTDAVVNAVNTVGVMGKGLALQFKHAYPEMFVEYQSWCRAGELRVGKMHVWERSVEFGGPRLIINFPTKRHWRDPSRVEDIQAGLDELAVVVGEWEVRSIAIPALGCGLGGLEWSEVELLIVAAMEPLTDDLDIFVYRPGDMR